MMSLLSSRREKAAVTSWPAKLSSPGRHTLVSTCCGEQEIVASRSGVRVVDVIVMARNSSQLNRYRLRM